MSHLEQISADLKEKVKPAWTTDVAGMFGQPAVGAGFVAVYAKAKVGLRLAVFSTATGKLLWDHSASPGATFTVPFLGGFGSAARVYPTPPITPIIVNRSEGKDVEPLIVYFERVDTGNDDETEDRIHAVNAKTGKDAKITVPGYDDADSQSSVRANRDGTVVVDTNGPPRVCGAGPALCFEDSKGGFTKLDIRTMRASYLAPNVPGDDLTKSVTPMWGPDYADVTTDTSGQIARYTGGTQMWLRNDAELFGVERMNPPANVDFRPTRNGKALVVQGYQPILTSAEHGTYSLDFVTSRTAVSLDPASGKTQWLLKGGDSDCYAVANFVPTSNAKVLPMCLAKAGSFVVSSTERKVTESKDIEASVVGVNVADGSIAWQVTHAGDVSLAQAGRLSDSGFASRGDLSFTPRSGVPGLLDLTTGKWVKSPTKSTFMCDQERADVEPTFDQLFNTGSDPLATTYAGGWFDFPCTTDRKKADWSVGAVSVAGYGAGTGVTVIPTESGLAGFTLPR